MLTYLEAWTMFLSLVLQKMCGTEATPSKLHRWWHGLTTPTGSAQKPICTPHNLWQWFRSKDVCFVCLLNKKGKWITPISASDNFVICWCSMQTVWKASSKIFYWLSQGGTSFVDLLCFFCLSFAMPLCTSVYVCLVVTCWERADLLALVCGVRLWVCHFPIGILGQVWYLIVSIPDLCTHTYFNTGVARAHDEKCL